MIAYKENDTRLDRFSKVLLIQGLKYTFRPVIKNYDISKCNSDDLKCFDIITKKTKHYRFRENIM